MTLFFRKVRPGGPGWKPLQKENPDIEDDGELMPLLYNWVAGVVLVYMALFGFGHFLFGNYMYFTICLVAGLLALGYLYWDLSKRGFDTIIEVEDFDHKRDASEAGQ